MLSTKAYNFDFSDEKDARDFYEDVTKKHRKAKTDELVSVESIKGLFSFYKDMLGSVSMMGKVIKLNDLK